MLKSIVGEVDLFSAAVLIAIFIGLAIVITTWLTTRRSKRSLEMEHEVALLKQDDATKLEHERIVGKIGIEQKKIDSGLITSHNRQSGRDE